MILVNEGDLVLPDFRSEGDESKEIQFWVEETAVWIVPLVCF